MLIMYSSWKKNINHKVTTFSHKRALFWVKSIDLVLIMQGNSNLVTEKPQKLIVKIKTYNLLKANPPTMTS